jgi:hypothetical protein
MADASEIHGVVFKNGSATLLARVVGADGSPVTQASIASARYTVYLLDDADADAGAPVAGHTAVAVSVASLVYDSLQKDNLWDVDDVGYNFKHVLDVSAHPAFAAAGRSYRIVFELTPATGQVVLVRFRVYAI